MFDERTADEADTEPMSEEMHRLAKLLGTDYDTLLKAIPREMRQLAVESYGGRLDKMFDDRIIDEATVEAISNEMRQIAIDTFGDKLDKLYLYEVNPGGREDPDLRFLVVLNVTHEEVYDEDRKLSDHPVDLGLKYDVLHYTKTTSSEYFNRYKNSTVDYRIAVEEGVLLYG